MFTKSRLEHKFSNWNSSQLGSVDVAHVVLLVFVNLAMLVGQLSAADKHSPLASVAAVGARITFLRPSVSLGAVSLAVLHMLGSRIAGYLQ
jgi:hypothetical protein